ncbi:putative Hsp70 nucleotide exchange factor [Microthyrium microscopicum]|uniref:Putative Hsp70 nucleotide exchange factor n=1 Tax=Microthyrium microscopicum TaxID=703497 RepID=A0A6A6UJQ0_9PEZI|nr:putative Hsp70 nucleotide exchange factor [Microthyrium microscopicum]
MDRGLNEVLRWGIENSTTPNKSTDTTLPTQPARPLDPALLSALFGGPSDADLMRSAMAAIKSPDVDLENKLIAFDNFEQMIENLDNANNIEALKLWEPLIEELGNAEAEIRALAAWCVGTAVQNNEKSQEKCVMHGAVGKLVDLAVGDKSVGVRKKAILALSSCVRNYQPALDEALKSLPKEYRGGEEIDASDMEAIDGIIQALRDASAKKAEQKS